MAQFFYDKRWRNEFYINKSVKQRVQDKKVNQLKLEANGFYRKDENISTKVETFLDEDVVKKDYLDRELSRVEGQISSIEKVYIDHRDLDRRNKQFDEEFSFLKGCEEECTNAL